MDVINPNKLANQLGLSGISDDVEEMEKEASTERLEQIVPILPFLKSIASINSMVIAAIQGDITQNKPLAEDKDLEDVLESVREIIGQISMSALVAGFSAAISLGVVHSSGAVAKEVDNEQF
jgi:repressor of nif and glnA expression